MKLFSSFFLPRFLRPTAAVICLSGPILSFSATAQELQRDSLPVERVVITSQLPEPLALTVPDQLVGDTVSREQIDNSNVVNPEDALKYSSNLSVRKRYIGDQNSVVEVRGTNNNQSARTLVLLDGIPISNFLGSGYSFPPVWGLIGPEEIESVSTVYGPYSAKYSGNTLGAAIFITTHVPQKLEANLDVTGGAQLYDQYRTHVVLPTTEVQATVGDKIGPVHLTLYYDHLDSQAQPLYYAEFPVASGSATLPGVPVRGAVPDTDARGVPSLVLGAAGTEHDLTDLIKAKAVWDIDANTQLLTLFAFRNYDERILEPESYLRDATGNEVLTGRVSVDGLSYNLGPSFALQKLRTLLEDFLTGATLERRFAGGVVVDASVSGYDAFFDQIRVAQPDGSLAQVTDYNARYWLNSSLRAAWTPENLPPWIGSRVQAGFDSGLYRTDATVYNSDANLDGARRSFAERNAGATQLYGFYAQDTWSLPLHLELTGGLRWEWWNAFDGRREQPTRGVRYPERSQDDWSPKGVLAWRATKEWTVQFQAARAYRFPTVGELFQSRTTGAILTQSDPNLAPERSFDLDLTASRAVSAWGGAGLVSLSLFRDSVDNVIYSQQNATNGATYYQNVGNVRSHGVELNANLSGLFRGWLDLAVNGAVQDATVEENDALPGSVGKQFPRVPHYRAHLEATLHPARAFAFTVGLRYEGEQYNDLLNSDDESGGFGYVSDFLFVDLKARYFVNAARTVEIDAGVDNVNGDRAWVYHPYPQRTFLGSVRYKF